MDGLRGSGLLRRIFIDECHTILTDAGYRTKLAALVGVRWYGCPVIMLTATLPVLFESWFRRAMLAVDAGLIRDRTTKSNCRYRVDTVTRTPGAVKAQVVTVVQGFRATMLAGQKGIVYCRSKSQCEALAEVIRVVPLADLQGLTLLEKKCILIDRAIDAQGMGRYQWYIWSLYGCGYLLDLLWAHAFGLVLSPLQQELGFGNDRSGNIAMSFNVGLTAGAFVWGFMSDVVGEISFHRPNEWEAALMVG